MIPNYLKKLLVICGSTTIPIQYEAIRDYYVKKGVNLKDAKTRAAKIYIAKGKGKSRSSRAKALHKD